MLYVILFLTVFCLFCSFFCVVTLYKAIELLKHIDGNTISVYELMKELFKN